METETQESMPVLAHEAIVGKEVIGREALLAHLITDKRSTKEIYGSILARLKNYGSNGSGVNDEEADKAARNLVELYQVYFDGEIRRQRERVRQRGQKGNRGKERQEVKIDTELVKTIPLELLAEKDRRQK